MSSHNPGAVRLPLPRGSGPLGIIGDGNCQFRAAAFCLWSNQQQHGDVRRALIEHMEAEADGRLNYRNAFDRTLLATQQEDQGYQGDGQPLSFEHFLEDMGRGGVWGRDLTLGALANLYLVNFGVFIAPTDGGGGYYFHKVTPEMGPAASTYFLTFDGNHYDVLVKKSTGDPIQALDNVDDGWETVRGYRATKASKKRRVSSDTEPENACRAKRRAADTKLRHLFDMGNGKEPDEIQTRSISPEPGSDFAMVLSDSDAIQSESESDVGGSDDDRMDFTDINVPANEDMPGTGLTSDDEPLDKRQKRLQRNTRQRDQRARALGKRGWIESTNPDAEAGFSTSAIEEMQGTDSANTSDEEPQDQKQKRLQRNQRDRERHAAAKRARLESTKVPSDTEPEGSHIYNLKSQNLADFTTMGGTLQCLDGEGLVPSPMECQRYAPLFWTFVKHPDAIHMLHELQLELRKLEEGQIEEACALIDRHLGFPFPFARTLQTVNALRMDIPAQPMLPTVIEMLFCPVKAKYGINKRTFTGRFLKKFTDAPKHIGLCKPGNHVVHLLLEQSWYCSALKRHPGNNPRGKDVLPEPKPGTIDEEIQERECEDSGSPSTPNNTVATTSTRMSSIGRMPSHRIGPAGGGPPSSTTGSDVPPSSTSSGCEPTEPRWESRSGVGGGRLRSRSGVRGGGPPSSTTGSDVPPSSTSSGCEPTEPRWESRSGVRGGGPPSSTTGSDVPPSSTSSGCEPTQPAESRNSVRGGGPPSSTTGSNAPPSETPPGCEPTGPDTSSQYTGAQKRHVTFAVPASSEPTPPAPGIDPLVMKGLNSTALLLCKIAGLDVKIVVTYGRSVAYNFGERYYIQSENSALPEHIFDPSTGPVTIIPLFHPALLARHMGDVLHIDGILHNYKPRQRKGKSTKFADDATLRRIMALIVRTFTELQARVLGFIPQWGAADLHESLYQHLRPKFRILRMWKAWEQLVADADTMLPFQMVPYLPDIKKFWKARLGGNQFLDRKKAKELMGSSDMSLCRKAFQTMPFQEEITITPEEVTRLKHGVARIGAAGEIGSRFADAGFIARSISAPVTVRARRMEGLGMGSGSKEAKALREDEGGFTEQIALERLRDVAKLNRIMAFLHAVTLRLFSGLTSAMAFLNAHQTAPTVTVAQDGTIRCSPNNTSASSSIASLQDILHAVNANHTIYSAKDATVNGIFTAFGRPSASHQLALTALQQWDLADGVDDPDRFIFLRSWAEHLSKKPPAAAETALFRLVLLLAQRGREWADPYERNGWLEVRTAGELNVEDLVDKIKDLTGRRERSPAFLVVAERDSEEPAECWMIAPSRSLQWAKGNDKALLCEHIFHHLIDLLNWDDTDNKAKAMEIVGAEDTAELDRIYGEPDGTGGKKNFKALWERKAQCFRICATTPNKVVTVEELSSKNHPTVDVELPHTGDEWKRAADDLLDLTTTTQTSSITLSLTIKQATAVLKKHSVTMEVTAEQKIALKFLLSRKTVKNRAMVKGTCYGQRNPGAAAYKTFILVLDALTHGSLPYPYNEAVEATPEAEESVDPSANRRKELVKMENAIAFLAQSVVWTLHPGRASKRNQDIVDKKETVDLRATLDMSLVQKLRIECVKSIVELQVALSKHHGLKIIGTTVRGPDLGAMTTRLATHASNFLETTKRLTDLESIMTRLYAKHFFVANSTALHFGSQAWNKARLTVDFRAKLDLVVKTSEGLRTTLGRGQSMRDNAIPGRHRTTIRRLTIYEMRSSDYIIKFGERGYVLPFPCERSVMGGYQGKDIDYEWRTLYLTRNARDDKGQWKATLSLQRLPIPAIELPLAPAIEDGDQRILEAGKRYPSTSPRRARYKALYLKRLAAISQKTHYIPWEFDPDLDPEAFRGVKRTWNVWVKRRKQNTQTPWSTIPGLPTMISIDPGIKKFMVGYTSYGDTILFGRPSAEYITPALRKMDKIESHIGQMLERVPDIEKLREEVDARMKKWRAHAIALESLLDGDIFKRDFQDTIGDGLLSHACQLRDVIPKQKQELRERVCEEHVEEIEKLRASLGNKIDHLHIHTASFLEKFDIVLLPTFDVPKLVKRRVGQLSRLNKRILMTLQHATLRETLGHRQTVRGCGQTVHPSEAWSTQACFKCKRLSGKLRGRRFLCSDINCGNKMDRDENAPRSNLNLVMAKAISEWNPKGVEAVTEPDAIPLDRP